MTDDGFAAVPNPVDLDQAQALTDALDLANIKIPTMHGWYRWGGQLPPPKGIEDPCGGCGNAKADHPVDWPERRRSVLLSLVPALILELRQAREALTTAAQHPHKGPNDTDASMLLEAAKRIEGGYVAGGQHTRATAGRVLRAVASAIGNQP